MARLSVKEIREKARAIVAENPGGIRYAVLVEKIGEQSPETPKNTIQGSMWNLMLYIHPRSASRVGACSSQQLPAAMIPRYRRDRRDRTDRRDWRQSQRIRVLQTLRGVAEKRP